MDSIFELHSFLWGIYNPSLKLAMDIAAAFQVKVEDIFEFVEDEEKPL